jgi:GntR family transcriptional regulator, transcriptional repressor for pyruvate dehydrogenase complex
MNTLSNIKRPKIIVEATESLKNHILNGNYSMGEYLPPEHELCHQMGIGRSTLREAVMTLETQGLVKKVHGVGVMVVDESLRVTSEMLKLMLLRKGYSMKELFEVRFVNEVKTAELAAQNARPSDLESIEKHLLTMRNCMSTNDEYLQADIDFHLAIAKASQNTVFTMILQIVRPLMEDMIIETLKYNHRPEQSMKYHEKIYEAIKAGNPDAAAKSMGEHLRGTGFMLGF